MVLKRHNYGMTKSNFGILKKVARKRDSDKKKGFEQEKVGHFTALVWALCTKVGFGRARSKDGNSV